MSNVFTRSEVHVLYSCFTFSYCWAVSDNVTRREDRNGLTSSKVFSRYRPTTHLFGKDDVQTLVGPL